MKQELSKSSATRLRILDATARTLRNKGYAGTTLNEIALAAGLQAGSLFYHFGSKDELVEEVLDVGMLRVHEAVQASQARLAAGAPHRVCIRAAVEAHFATLLERGDYTSANIRIFGQVPEEIQRRHLRLRRAYAAMWRRLLTDAQKAGALRHDIDLGLVRMLLLGALNWSVEWYKPGRESVRALSDHVCLMVFDGIALPARRMADADGEPSPLSQDP